MVEFSVVHEYNKAPRQYETWRGCITIACNKNRSGDEFDLWRMETQAPLGVDDPCGAFVAKRKEHPRHLLKANGHLADAISGLQKNRM